MKEESGLSDEAARGHYGSLIEKIEVLSERQMAAYPGQFACKLGCDGCCRPPDSLFLIEVEPLERELLGLSSTQRELVEKQLDEYIRAEREECPLLHEGGCMVYEGRPTICRTHGHAIWMKEEEELSWCPLNFQEITPERAEAFDVERLNQMLSLVTQLRWPGESGRVSLVKVIGDALGAAKG